MDEDQNIEQGPKDSKSERPEEVKENISPEQIITPAEFSNQTSEIPKSEIKEMEVHHHPHVDSHLHGKKNFKEYFLEFLMIFLAVTMGFFAESLREHFTDIKIANEYLETYKQELEHNEKTIHRYDSVYSVVMLAEDSMAMLFYNKKENEDLNRTARLFVHARIFFPTILEDGAYQQLINSGGLKFIHNADLKDSMAHYSYAMQRFFSYNQIEYADRSAVRPELNSLDDIHDWTSAKIPEIDPYPELTERERRFMVSFYRQNYIQLLSNIRSLSGLNRVNENLLKMVQDELNK